MIIKFLFVIILISLFCNGIYLLFNFGNVFDFIRRWYIDIAGGIQNNSGAINWTMNIGGTPVHKNKIFLYKPLFGCITCMSSIWGSIAYWTIMPFTLYSLTMYPMIIVCSACVNLLINRLYE